MIQLRHQIKLSGAVVVLTSIVMLYLASNMMLSGIYDLKTQLFLEDWQNKQTTPNKDAWQTALESSQNAQAQYLVKDAFLQERIGKVNQWKTYANPVEDTSVLKEREAALSAYRQQAQITPSWPKAWFNLLSIKIELNQFDSEFYQAFKLAQETTNRTPSMHTPLVLVGVQAFKQVNNATKNQILKNILHEASQNKQSSQNLKPVLQAYNLHYITCIYAKAIKATTHNLCKS